jgi:tetratricopeptide (TPR) repeat protein
LNYENARTEAERAQAGLPSDPLPSLILGYIARRQGRWDEALRDFNRALELDPRSAFILNQLGFAYCSLRRYPEMAQTLERAIALAPGEIFTRAQRALVDLEARADTRPLRELLDAFNLSHRNDATETAEHSYYLGLCERDTTRVKRSVDLLGTDGCFTEGVSLPREFCEGIAARLDGDEGKASSAFAAAVKASENYVRNQPQYGGAICGLALAHAAAGNKAEAIQHGRAAVELLPTEKDAVDGPLLQGYLAVVYGWTGEIDLAIEQLAAATSVPSYWSYGNLKLHPYWDPLRGDPRFEQIVASLAPK